MGTALTVRTAALDVTVPTELLTLTEYEPASAAAVAAMV